MLKVKDIVALGALAAVSFPVVLLGVLLWTGNVRLVFGPEAQDPTARARLLERPEDIPGATKSSSDSAASHGGPTDSSLLLRQADLDRREAEALRETQRVLMIQQDDSRLRDTITAERKRMEALLGKNDSLGGSRTAALAATFSNMKADQAAKILLALDDGLAVAVLRRMTDDKPRAKILANMGKIDVRRAAQVSRLLAAVPGPARAEAGESAQPAEAAADTAKSSKSAKAPAASPVPHPKTEKKS